MTSTNEKEYISEKVTYIPSPLNNGECIPRIEVSTHLTSSSTGETTTTSTKIRPFHPHDMSRILDHDNMPEPPADTTLAHLEYELTSDDMTISDYDGPPSFPARHVCLRGSYLFYFDPEDIQLDAHARSVTYAGPPLGCIPLERTVVEFPPGGRRVFREHATTDAKNGYELAIRHQHHRGGDAGSGSAGADKAEASSGGKKRAPAYLVAHSLGERSEWAAAIRLRADAYRKDTKLRAGGRTDAAAAESDVATDVVSDAAAVDIGVMAAAANVDAGDGNQNHASGGRISPSTGGAASLPTATTTSTTTTATTSIPGRRNKLRPASASRSLFKSDSDGTTHAPNRDAAMANAHVPSISVLAGVIQSEEQAHVTAALQQFGMPKFDEWDYVNEFFDTHNEFDAPTTCRRLEQWQNSIKKGLRGAVLEQYEYFVEASREMTTMGREISSLKSLVDGQLECIENMKNIEFASAFGDAYNAPSSSAAAHPNAKLNASHNLTAGMFSGLYGEDEDDVLFPDDEQEYSSDDDDDDDDNVDVGVDVDDANTKSTDESFTSAGPKHASSGVGGGGAAGAAAGHELEHALPPIEIPTWLADATDEISAFIKECRYTDATELLLKAKTEITEILNQHEKLTEKKLSKKQLASMQRILRSIDDLTDRICKRLSEGLRRRNEALKQAAKRERADPLSVLAPHVSPICLNDDSTSLSLLVKLGKSQDAAAAFAARRSLLLMECLYERPISSSSSPNKLDIIIYAAQLSQSFFTCLAICVENFLDLFLGSSKLPTSVGGGDFDENSSINSGLGDKNVPAGALASIALWCDSEVSKFCATFGSKVFGNLELSAPSNATMNAITARITKFETVADLTHLRNQLRAAEEMGEHIAASKLRKKIAIQEKEEKEGKVNHKVMSKTITDKERQAAIDTAAKCVDQAFTFSSESLNSIGLPLTPRLAEYLRPRLKGCEAEVAIGLEDKWEHVTFDWKNASVVDVSSPRSSRRLSLEGSDLRGVPSTDSAGLSLPGS